MPEHADSQITPQQPEIISPTPRTNYTQLNALKLVESIQPNETGVDIVGMMAAQDMMPGINFIVGTTPATDQPRQTIFSQAAVEELGLKFQYTADSPNLFTLIDPYELTVVQKTIEESFQNGSPIKHLECHIKDKIYDIETKPIVSKKTGQVQFLTARMTDITEVYNLARQDKLTGLGNKHMLQEALLRLDRQMYAAKTEGNPFELTAAFLDLDDMKKLNDTFGHQVVDDLLSGLGGAIKESVRADDIAIRFGGDEFLLLLPSSNIEGGQKVIDRIKTNIAQIQVPADHPELRTALNQLTLSIGLSNLNPENPKAVAELLLQADRAVYRAKEAGKNRTIVYDQSMTNMQVKKQDEIINIVNSTNQ